MSRKWGVFLPIVVFLSACTTLPTGPNAMVLPGVGKPFDQFQVDDMLCRQYAQGQIGITPDQGWTQRTVGGLAVGTLLGRHWRGRWESRCGGGCRGRHGAPHGLGGRF
jgi:hypothetical protein